MITRPVLHAIDTGGSGGAETVFAAVAAGVDPHRYTPVTAVDSDGWLAAQLRARGLTPHVVPAGGSFNLGYLLRLLRLIRSNRVQIVQSHLFGSNVYCSLAGWLCGVPVVSAFHGDVDINPSSRLLRLKLALVNLGSRRIVCVSDRLRDELAARGYFPSERLTTIHNGVDTERFQPARDHTLRDELGILPDELLIGAVGNIRRPKRYDLLLHAAALLRQQGHRFRLVIAGQGRGQQLDELLALRTALGLEGQVHLLGFRADAARLLNNLDLFVLSSISEGFSIATVEAMACGLPVVVTRSGGPEEIVTDGFDGVLVEAGRPEPIADALARLIADPELRARLATRARETAVRRFSLTAMTDAYEALYAGL